MNASCHFVEKSFRDYSIDIEAVSIHYVISPDEQRPDWSQRSTLFLPRVDGDVRKIALMLPRSIESSKGVTNHYLLHYYFEICKGGDRVYSPQFTEQVVTDDPEDG
jgi:hypothetical protein